MKVWTSTYYQFFGYGLYDFIPSELSGARAVDIAHIVGKGRGGKHNIENLMANTREEHHLFGDITELVPILSKMHIQFMKTRQPIFEHSPTREELIEWMKEN